MHSIVLLTANHLCHNPRVQKEACCLANAGYAVEVLGTWTDVRLKGRDCDLLAEVPFSYTPIIDTTLSDLSTKITKANFRLIGKVARLAHRYLGISSRLQLGCSVDLLCKAARRRCADLYIAHSEAGMVAAMNLMADGFSVGVDMEDWFSEDLLPEARRNRPLSLLRNAEQTLLRRGYHTTCPSQVMSSALATEFGCLPPKVIYNTFPWSDRKLIDGQFRDRKDCSVPSIHWYSQTIGHGRGLEDLFNSLPYLDCPVEVHLRGNHVAGFDEWLRKSVPVGFRERIFVHPIVPVNQLISRIAEHDIGFAGEMKYSWNKDLTVSNKILQYLLAGLAVVASDTAGQTEIAEHAPGAIQLYPSGEPQALAVHLNELLASPDRLRNAKAAALEAAEGKFCWERQEKVLLESVASALVRN